MVRGKQDGVLERSCKLCGTNYDHMGYKPYCSGGCRSQAITWKRAEREKAFKAALSEPRRALVCPECHGHFTPKRKRKYCSIECAKESGRRMSRETNRGRYRRMVLERQGHRDMTCCRYCKKEFPRSRNFRYCSKKCERMAKKVYYNTVYYPANKEVIAEKKHLKYVEQKGVTLKVKRYRAERKPIQKLKPLGIFCN